MSTSVKEDEDMQMALALSLSAQSSQSAPTIASGTSKSSRSVRSKLSKQPIPVKPKRFNTNNKPAAPKAPSSDIFESMGLSAKPNFSSNASAGANSNASAQTASSGKYSSNFTSVSASSYPKTNALNNDDECSTGTSQNWEDDDDLDDLLGD